jgi:hypothetical protein
MLVGWGNGPRYQEWMRRAKAGSSESAGDQAHPREWPRPHDPSARIPGVSSRWSG